jgi:hypothetical protein
MLCLLRNKKAQNTMEYALIIAVVIGVFSAMQIYVKRSLQARVRSGADSSVSVIGAQAEAEPGGSAITAQTAKDFLGTQTQYEPYYIARGAYNMTTDSIEGEERGTTARYGGVRDLEDATSSRTGSQTITGTNPPGVAID